MSQLTQVQFSSNGDFSSCDDRPQKYTKVQFDDCDLNSRAKLAQLFDGKLGYYRHRPTGLGYVAEWCRFVIAE